MQNLILKNSPVVSVYVPTHNRSKLLKRAIESVQAQTYQNFELIIVDDCSSDDTCEVVKSYQKEDSRIKYLKNETNKGGCYSRNRAIETAQGEFITGLDDDDYFLPHRLKDFIDSWQKEHNNRAFLFSTSKGKYKDGIVQHGKSRLIRQKGYLRHQDMLITNLIGNQFFTTTDNVRQIAGFDENLRMWQDYDLLLRLLKIGDAFCVDNYSYVVDVSHDGNRISTDCKNKLEETYCYMIEKHNINSIFMKQVIRNNFFHYSDEFIALLPLFCGLIYHPNTSSLNYLEIYVRTKIKKLLFHIMKEWK